MAVVAVMWCDVGFNMYEVGDTDVAKCRERVAC